MLIREIALNNFRIYKGTNIIPLQPDGGKNIIVVSGKNGFGKTTFLMSLVWCLYGRQMHKVDDLYKKEIDSKGGYSKYLADSLNRLAAANGETKFSVSVTFKDVKIPTITCEEVKVIRSFDVKTASEDKVEILIDGQPNEMIIDDLEKKDNQRGEEIFIRDFILPLEIAKFFFFDAEKIVSLAEINSPEQRRQLSRAYSEVLGIHKYEELKQNLEKLQDEYRKESAKPGEREEFNRVIAEIENYKIEIETKDEEIESLREKKSANKYESDEIQKKLIRDGNKMTLEELQELKGKEAKLTRRMDELQEELRESLDMIPFALAGNLLFDVAKQLEDEESFRKNRFQQQDVEDKTYSLLTDLEETRSTSDIKFDARVHEFYTNEIKHLIKKHFYPDVPDLDSGFEALHDFSDNERNELNALINDLVSSFKQKFRTINKEFTEAKNDLQEIKKKIFNAEKEQENTYIAGLREDKHRLDSEILTIEGGIEDRIKEIEQIKLNQKLAEKRKTELHNKIQVSQKNKKKDEKAKQLIKELNDFIIKFKEEKKKSLEKSILAGLNTLMHKKDFIKKVTVDISVSGDDVDINLEDKRKKQISKESLSMGEKQMYASALLKALVEESDIEFPVFIDSPMQKFDEEHAQNIIQHFYPTISNQVVLFPLINKELTEREFKALKKNIAQTYIIANTVDSSEFLPVEPEELITQHNKLYNAN